MMPPVESPSAEGRFIIEIDGLPAIAALEATPSEKKTPPIKYQPANQFYPDFVSGYGEV